MINNTTKKYYLILNDSLEEVFYRYEDLISYAYNFLDDFINEINGVIEVYYNSKLITGANAISIDQVLNDIDDLKVDIINARREDELFELDNRLMMADLI